MCSLQQILVKTVQRWCNTKPLTLSQPGLGDKWFCEVPGLLHWLGCITSGTKLKRTPTSGTSYTENRATEEKS